jgi:hypothetical protein
MSVLIRKPHWTMLNALKKMLGRPRKSFSARLSV